MKINYKQCETVSVDENNNNSILTKDPDRKIYKKSNLDVTFTSTWDDFQSSWNALMHKDYL